MKFLLGLLALLGLPSLAVAAVILVSGALTANGNCDVASQYGGKTSNAIVTDVRGAFGSGTITFKASADGTNFINILDVTGDGVSCSPTACTCTANCVAQVKSAGSGPFHTYRAALTGATSPNIACTSRVDVQ